MLKATVDQVVLLQGGRVVIVGVFAWLATESSPWRGVRTHVTDGLGAAWVASVFAVKAGREKR